MDSFNSKSTLKVNNRDYAYFRLKALIDAKIGHVDRLPFSMKILLENVLRKEDGVNVTADDVKAVAGWDGKPSDKEFLLCRRV